MLSKRGHENGDAGYCGSQCDERATRGGESRGGNKHKVADANPEDNGIVR